MPLEVYARKMGVSGNHDIHPQERNDDSSGLGCGIRKGRLN